MQHSEHLTAFQSPDAATRIQALKALKETSPADIFPHVVPLLSDSHAKVQAAAAFALRYSHQPQAQPQLLELLQSEQAAVKVAALFTLGEWADPEVIPHLAPLLKEESPVLRSRAAEALGKVGAEQAIEPLYEALENEEHLKVALRLAESLLSLGDTRVLSVLMAALEYDDNEIRNRAVEILVKHPQEAAIAGLIDILKGEEQAARAASVFVLSNIGHLDTEALVPLLSDDVRAVRSGIAKALGEIGDPAVIPAMMEALHDEDRRVRTRAAQALGKLQAQEAVLELEQALAQDDSRRVRWRAAEALRALAATETTDTFVQALGDEDSSVRLECLRALADWKVIHALEAIVVCLEDPIRRVRCGAARALGELGDYRALGPLRDTVWQDDEESVRLDCTRALGKLRQYLKDTAEALLQLESQASLTLSDVLQDTSQRVRSEAIKELIKANASVAVEPLIELLDEEDATLRAEAAEALGQLQSPAAFMPLFESLSDGDSQVRNAAVQALVELAQAGVPEELVHGLIQGLQSQEMRLRTSCSRVLSQIAEQIIDMLLPYLYHADERLRSSVVFVLGESGDGRALSYLVNALQDSEARVRTAAAEAVEKIASTAIAPLAASLDTATDDRLKTRSIQAMGRLLKRLQPPLEHVLSEENENMRQLAQKALQGADENTELVI